MITSLAIAEACASWGVVSFRWDGHGYRVTITTSTGSAVHAWARTIDGAFLDAYREAERTLSGLGGSGGE